MDFALLPIFGLLALGAGGIGYVVWVLVRPDRVPKPPRARRLSNGQLTLAIVAGLAAVAWVSRLIAGAPVETAFTATPIASVDSNCTIVEGAPLANTAANAEEARRSLTKNDTANLAAMMAAGHIVFLKKAALARVTQKDGATIRVRVLDPGAFGLERWIPERLCR